MKYFFIQMIIFASVLSMTSCSELKNFLSPDTHAPVIELVGPKTIELNQFENYTELGAKAVDEIDGSITVEITGLINTTEPGSYTVTYTAKDSQGNQSSLTRTVIVLDITAPVISLIGENEILLELGQSYIEPGVVAQKEEDANAMITVSGDLDVSKIGTYTLVYQAKDAAGNLSEFISRTVNIQDTTSPILSLIGDSHVVLFTSDQYIDQGISVDDYSDFVVQTNTINLDETGTQSLIYKVIDSSGNESIIERLIEVKEDFAPVITFENESEIELLQGVDIDFDPATLATAIDEKDGVVALSVQNEIDIYEAGTYSLLFSAQDSNNQTTQIEKTVTVIDNPFITTWKTDNTGASNDNQITLTANLEDFPNEYNYSVDWGDGKIDTAVTESITHTYASEGTYQISITGDFPHFAQTAGLNNSDAQKLLSVDHWGGNKWLSMSLSFNGATNMTVQADDSPILISVTNMNGMFNGADSFNQDISGWNVSSVTNMNSMFSNTENFNQDISNWDVSNVTDMKGMFAGTQSFNQPLNSWDVSSVIDMTAMFAGSKAFQQPLNNWDISSVTNMTYMFIQSVFNSAIDGWNTSSVLTMNRMFLGTVNFNQEIGDWDVSSVVDMEAMFESAIAFNQNINDWDVSSLTNVALLFNNAEVFNQPLNNWSLDAATDLSHMFLNAKSFNQNLNDWDVSKITNMNRMFENAIAFNGAIQNWDVSSVVAFNSMFSQASKFNQDISQWNLTSAKSMAAMFSDAIEFNQDLSSWNIANITNMANMFVGVNLSTQNYDALLNSWSTQIPQDNVIFNAGNSQYTPNSPAQTARHTLTDTFNWTITDGGPEVVTP
ncbi:BspA family leucine-rich repeat surface protein [Marinicellulosiphila megalodicopiae]|uniref:BspA family leucine-rich repeat surface protein n=1 Tax=Marinicellulosiphila megalodicopiae TaxID=2724896 RepID=UPI003BAFA528